MRRRLSAVAIVASASLAGTLLGAGSPAVSAVTPAASSAPSAPAAQPESVDDPTSARDEKERLPEGWQRSRDRLWTLAGDATGAHLLVADQDQAYTWRTVATLREPGIEADSWIGNACLTESGRRAVVTYAPRSFSNDGSLMLRGGFTAVVDLETGSVDKLPVRSTLAYFSPGCGSGERAVLTATRLPEESGAAQTRLTVIDARDGSTVAGFQRRGQLTSAVPTPIGVVAALGPQVVHVTPDRADPVITAASTTPSFLTVDRDGGLVYLSGTREANGVDRIPLATRKVRGVARARSVEPTTLLTSQDGWLEVAAGANGSAFVLGSAASDTRDLGHGVSTIPADVTAEVSTTGDAVLETEARPAPESQAAAAQQVAEAPASSEPGEAVPVDLAARVVSTGDHLDFTVLPGLRAKGGYAAGWDATSSGRQPPSARLASVTGTVETNRSCSVPRNDPKSQVYQPTPRQVEWAVSQAVVENLMTARPANWKQSGLPSWVPQQMFPTPALAGGGRIPAQVLLGILAQESNLWQASYHARPGVLGNPLVGNFYGRDIYSGDDESVDPWTIRWDEADCGYGVGQITDGMRREGHAREGEVLLSPNKQRAVALDYATNIAAAARILAQKWNQTYNAGLIHDDGDPAALENWVFAIWAYNSGFYADKGTGEPWGVGWLNNPANPIYMPNRELFNKYPTDPKTPNLWPYQERVIGWAAYPIGTNESPDGVGYRAAWWVSDAARAAAQPPNDAFCKASNDCDFGAEYQPTHPDVSGAPAGPCAHRDSLGRYDLKCWWNQPTTYNNCENGYCGNELKRFNTSYPEQPDGTNYPPVCTKAGLPAGSWVVDDVPASAPSARPDCGHPWTDQGSFSLTSASPSARVDLHQIGAGFGGHFWFAHSRKASDEGGRLEATGTWTFDQTLNKWARVLVHMPDHGAHTQQAAYRISLGNGTTKTRYALQRTRANQWVSLGVMKFNGTPKISLSSNTYDGTGSDDVAWDAVAIQPLDAKPRHFVVALGDSYSSGEGATGTDGVDYFEETDVLGELANDAGRNACHRSKKAWSRKAVLKDSTQTLGQRADSFDNALDFQFHACSGAESENVLPYHSVPAGEPKPENLFGQTGRGQYGEMSQIDKGYLDANTTLVLISMGGNDARFADIVTECVFAAGLQACPDTELSGESEDMDVTVPRDINGRVRRSLEVMIIEIAKRAPNAKIVLMGYPKLMENNGSCVPGIGSAEAPWLNEMGQVMADMMANLVGTSEYGLRAAGYQVWHADPIDDFAGQAICGDPETIHGISMDKTEGDKPSILDQPVAAASFHPKTTGTTHYRDALQSVLRLPGVGLGS